MTIRKVLKWVHKNRGFCTGFGCGTFVSTVAATYAGSGGVAIFCAIVTAVTGLITLASVVKNFNVT